MRHLVPFLSSSIDRITCLTGILVVTMGWVTCLAEESPPRPSSPVRSPQETQHGFLEFESLPDFFEEKAPTETSVPYHDYSNSPNLPSSDHKPGGLFASLTFAESVEEDQTIRQGHILVPVNPTDTFPSSTKSVHLVFAVHEHLAPFQIIGRLFPEQVQNADATQWIDEDRADLALEDVSGYLKFFAQDGKWRPGRYRVDIYVGYMVNTMNKMGTMRFSIHQESLSPALDPS